MYPPYQLPIYRFYCFAAKHNAADFFNHIIDSFLLQSDKNYREEAVNKNAENLCGFPVCLLLAAEY